jgi:hypothetical protein
LCGGNPDTTLVNKSDWGEIWKSLGTLAGGAENPAGEGVLTI